jgi:flagellar basal-body rod protein FlgF
MDKLLYVAMSGAKETLRAQAANNHNIANASTTGFKADMTAFQSRAVSGAGFPSRVYATDGTLGSDFSAGAQITTGNPLDIAINGNGLLAVQDGAGNEAYTRAGDLHVDPSGMLLTATGHPVLGDGGPITVPPATTMTIGTDGTVSLVPLGQTPNTAASVGRIKLVNPASGSMVAGPDGLFRAKDGAPLAADAQMSITPAVLETSNVNLPTSMVNMIELARRFDLQVKALQSADQNGAAATKLLQSS